MTSLSNSSSLSSSSSAVTARKSRKVPERIRPFTTDQLAELDLFLGNTSAAKGKTPSSAGKAPHSKDTIYVAPYIPLDESAPAGTRSFGRDGEMHPIGKNIVSPRAIGTGAALPFRDEQGILWSSQEEIDEFEQLIPEEKQRRRQWLASRRGSDESWKPFTPGTASSLGSTHSILRSNASEVFDLGYDEAVMIPEGGAVGLAKASTFGNFARTRDRSSAFQNTRGVESFPGPQIPALAIPPYHRRPPGSRRRSATTAETSTVVTPGRAAKPSDDEARIEYFANAFTPPSPPSAFDPSINPFTLNRDSPAALKRHSISLGMGSAKFLSNVLGSSSPASPLSPSSPSSYLAPMASPNGYTGIRQQSYSGPAGVHPSRALPIIPEKRVKSKGSGLTLSQMFKKFGGSKA